MQLDHYPVVKLKEQIATIAGWYLDLTKYRVFFFGSRVERTAGERSDIDVGIDGPEPIPLRIMGAIQEAVSSIPALYKVDVVDFRMASPEFRDVALQHVEPIAGPGI